MADEVSSAVPSGRELVSIVEEVGVKKAHLPIRSTVLLGILAGAYIGLGSMVYTLVTSDVGLGFAARQLLGGLSFALGLILVVVAGAELLTGNLLMTVAWSAGRLRPGQVLANWLIVAVSNYLGAAGLAWLVLHSGNLTLNSGAVATHAVAIAAHKTSLPFWTAFTSAILCNLLVCLAVWMAYAARSVAGKIAAIIFPITAFVAAGFEHSVANMYLLTMGVMLHASGIRAAGDATVNVHGMIGNLIPVILGNVVGGGVIVGLFYHFAYPRPSAAQTASNLNEVRS